MNRTEPNYRETYRELYHDARIAVHRDFGESFHLYISHELFVELLDLEERIASIGIIILL